MIRRAVPLLLALGVLAPNFARAAGIPAPPGLLAMWHGRDGATVRADLRRFAAGGDVPGATASQRLDAGEAAYWLGVQDARAGRTDSAIVEWRRAMTLRRDFDEGFALIEALVKRGQPDDLAEARAYAGEFAREAGLSAPQRAAEAHARFAWALHALGRHDSARVELHDNGEALRRRAPWTRRFADIELAAGDTAAAWRSLVMLAARARRADAEVESLLVRAQRALRYPNERRELSVRLVLDPALEDERAFVASLNGTIEIVRAKDGFPVQIMRFPARRDTVRGTSLLFLLSAADTLAAVDSLVAAWVRTGRPVTLLAPRGSFGSVGRGAYGPEAALGREEAYDAQVAADAGQVMTLLERRDGARSSGWMVGAAGERATAALELVRTRPGVHALLLVAPRLPVVEFAEFRARLAAARTRTYAQVSPEEPAALEFADLLAQHTPVGQVRVADSGMAGRGAAIFRAEGKVARRVLDWLVEKPKSR